MIKKTFCFSNPAYLSLRDAQLVIKLPEVEKADNLTEAFKKANEVTRPIEDIGSQPLAFLVRMEPRCLCHCKGTIFLANHNWFVS